MSLLFPIILMLLRISPCFGLGGSLLYIDFMKRHTYWFCPNGIPSIEIIIEKQLYYTRTFSLLVLIRHFSHMVKSRIFKNLNLKRKAVRNFRGNLLKSHFRHLNSYSNLRSWLTRGRWHMSNFSKTKGWSSHFWDGQLFRFCYVRVHRQRRLKSMKTGIST